MLFGPRWASSGVSILSHVSSEGFDGRSVLINEEQIKPDQNRIGIGAGLEPDRNWVGTWVGTGHEADRSWIRTDRNRIGTGSELDRNRIGTGS